MRQLTICNYYLKTIKWIKVAFIVNVLIYAVYFIGIYDIVSCLTQVITAIIGFISLVKLIKDEYEKGHTVAVHTYTHNYNIYK